MQRILLVAGLVVSLSPSVARASQASATTEQLVGWSADAKTWAVISTEQGGGDQELLVYRAGAVILTLCVDHSDDPDDHAPCVGSKTTKVVRPASTDKHTTLERVNVEKHPALAAFALKRVTKGWRTGFKKGFTIVGADPHENPVSEVCSRKWILKARVGAREVGSNKVAAGCLRGRGGYLHPKGKHVLIKQEENSWSTGEEFETRDQDSYILVPLR